LDFEIKFKSIKERWFANVFLIVLALLLVASIVLSVFLSNVYVERVKTLAEDYSYAFSELDGIEEKSFRETAINISDSFEYKAKIEVQVIDKSDNVILSTTGFLPSDDEKIPDLVSAKKSKEKTAYFKGKNSGGEKILSSTTLVYNSSGEYMGAYRWITSLKQTNRQLLIVILAIAFFALIALFICFVSGIFFIKSILKPINDVSNATRRIAMGDLKTRIELERNDEIGGLCDAINYMATELSQAESMKNDFISSVSHELRTPLTAIKGWGETAKMSLGTDEELVGRGLDVVLSEADRLSNLVEELLDFSRMQEGRLSVNVKPIDIVEQLTVATDMYTELAKKQGVEISFNRPSAKSVVLGDPDRLKQVFINIIDNAVKYTEKGGLVLVTSGEEEGCVKVTVKDTGVGIPAQDIDRVKEKFFKSNKTVRGSGIGLAVADEIIKQHNGLLFLESTEGVGTTVTIVLPIYEEPEEVPATATEEVIITEAEKIENLDELESSTLVVEETREFTNEKVDE